MGGASLCPGKRARGGGESEPCSENHEERDKYPRSEPGSGRPGWRTAGAAESGKHYSIPTFYKYFKKIAAGIGMTGALR